MPMPSTLRFPLAYHTDILGPDFDATTLTLPDDHEGPVVATLIRKLRPEKTTKAVLYIHGYLDYFFQQEMAERFNAQGYNFYALDLRKYGRSLLPHQQAYEVTDLHVYDAEIAQALHIIWREGHQHLLLAGHSTGGLICSSYAARHAQHPLIKALWLNSPFFDFHMPKYQKKWLLPQLVKLGQICPNLPLPSGLNKLYAASLHQDFYGEWAFNLAWKKPKQRFVPLSFIRAIYQAQQAIHQGLTLHVPTLIMHSHQTQNPKTWGLAAQSSDVILDVTSIAHYGAKIQGDTQIIALKNALHDVILSQQPVRELAYAQLFAWLSKKGL